MKTKISHLGRSTVSVILAVMMLLSTMLIGTITTANAVDIQYYYRGSDNNWGASAMTQSTDGKYFYIQSSSATNQFKIANSTTTYDYNSTYVQKGFNNTDVQNIGNYSGDDCYVWQSGTYYILVYVPGTDINTTNNPIICASTTLPQASVPVAESVSLTASPATVTSGGSTTLTATLKNKATGVDKVTYTFKNADGTEVGTVKDSAENTASVNVDNITSDTTYTVTVSADGYSDVTGSTTVAMPESTTLNFMVKSNDTDISKGVFKKIGDEYILDVTFDQTGDYSFYVKDDKGNNNVIYYRNQVGILEDLTSNVTLYKYGSNNAGHYVTLSVATPGTYGIKMTKSGENYSVSLYKIPDTSVTYTVNYGVNGDNGTLTADGVTSGSTVNSGTKVTFTANPSKGYAVEGWYSDAECTKKIESAGTNKTYTEKVNADTNVYVKFRTANTYTVNFSSSNETYGTVSATNGTNPLASGETVTEGDEVTFTAKPEDGYALSGWTVNGVSASSTDNPYKITVNQNTDVVANFVTGTQSKYYLLCGVDQTFKAYKSVPLVEKGNGEYYADFDAAGITKDKDYYIIFSTKEDTSGIIDSSKNNGNAKVSVTKVENNNGFSFYDQYSPVSQTSGNTGSVKFSKVIIKSNSNVTGFTIKISGLDVDNKTITYSAEPKFYEAPANTVEITAKDGTIRDGFTNTEKGKTTAVLGDTTLSIKTPDNTEITVSDSCKIDGENRAVTAKNVPKGSTVTVTTTIKPNATFAGHNGSDYYVKGFVVNGESYGIQPGANETGAYTLKYQIPDDVADGTNFEITPVYFLKNSSNCVTFYVEGFDGDIQKSWGNTIACYPYYEGVADKDNAFGAYPGQPLLYEGGKYYTQIPKSITLDGADKKIVGMTLNNFALESVHNAISPIKDNKQSYDYDDFVRIANNNYGDNIIFTFKYSTAYDNFGEKTVSDDTIKKADFGNGWEDLTDYNHSKVDLFGNVLTGDNLNKEPLLVVSNGYFENYQGFYATEWTVYKLDNGTYTKIAQIPSSALLLKSKEDLINSTSDPKYKNALKDYADAYGKLEAYKNTPAQITFEKSITKGFSLQGNSNGQGGESAERVDGRWYYSKIGEDITAKIAVEYGDTATSTFKTDPFVDGTNITTNIGAQAYFTNEGADSKTIYKSHIDSSKYFTFTADTIATDKSGQNYVFLGWYLLSDEKYTKLTDAKAPMTGSDTFVARYVKAPEGTVTIDHRLFSAASNPTPTQTPGTGSGKCYVTVRVLDKTTGALIKEFAETENSVTLDKTYINSVDNYELQITLRTVTSGQDQFEKFYYLAQDKKNYLPIDSSTTTTGNETKVTRMVDIRENFFKLNDDGTYSFKNETGSDSIHYYSDIKETKIPYKITFNYEPRLESDAKQYVVTGEFTSEYILNHGAVLTNDFVMSVAPYEDNFFNTIKWDNANITINNDTKTKTAVVNSTTSSRTVTVKAFDADGTPIEAYKLNNVPEYISTVVYGKLLTYDNLCGLKPDEMTEIAGDKEYIYVADPEYKGKKFSYWQISTSLNKDDTSAYVTKCFSQEFNYIAYNDYYIWPVYGESQSITGASTTLNFLDYSRNQSTDLDGGSKTDRVFADFALAFDSNGIQLQTYKGTNIKVGMFLEVCGDLESDSTGNVITDINYYKGKPGYNTSETDLGSIKAAILADSANKSLTYTTVDGITRKLLNKPIDIKSLDNKNRIEYYVGYNNNPNNQKKLMRAYSYVIVDNEITLCSTPYSFVNYYDVGNKTYTVS